MKLLFASKFYVTSEVLHTRAPDNFLKQGVADTSLGVKGVFLQNPVVFSVPCFYTRAFLEVTNLVLGKRKIAAHNQPHNLHALVCYIIEVYLHDSGLEVGLVKHTEYVFTRFDSGSASMTCHKLYVL